MPRCHCWPGNIFLGTRPVSSLRPLLLLYHIRTTMKSFFHSLVIMMLALIFVPSRVTSSPVNGEFCDPISRSELMRFSKRWNTSHPAWLSSLSTPSLPQSRPSPRPLASSPRRNELGPRPSVPCRRLQEYKSVRKRNTGCPRPTSFLATSTRGALLVGSSAAPAAEESRLIPRAPPR